MRHHYGLNVRFLTRHDALSCERPPSLHPKREQAAILHAELESQGLAFSCGQFGEFGNGDIGGFAFIESDFWIVAPASSSRLTMRRPNFTAAFTCSVSPSWMNGFVRRIPER